MLSNILGWKHGHVEPLGLWIHNHTRMGSDGNLCIESEGIKHKINPLFLYDAIAEGEMRYVISVRNPYAFIVGIFNHWERLSGENVFERCDWLSLIAEQCRDYSVKYRDWIRLHRDWPKRSAAIRHEAVVYDPVAVLGSIRNRLALDVIPLERTMISGQVEATQDAGTVVSRTAFRREWYKADGYLKQLDDQMINVIEAEIDWPTMAELGYTKGRQYSNWLVDRKV